ncbi:hypothetical protein Micbo1qcDRAFT_207792 [Microdochium bolleyi]|uniref:Uncharacterized protein n=1 Tax=Microdochium bolleyi TaxID=196109 RepID=A0A136ISQ8_9PEZI|nr:hypothetical protein Micbo1qcDRAFT_207792 [Microdochium bolleyi]
MVTQYRIFIQNDRQQEGNYTVFNVPPEVTSNTTAHWVYTNAWITRTIDVDDNFEIDFNKTCYAWAGTAPSSPGPGVVVQGGTDRHAILGSETDDGSNWPMTVESGAPKFGKEMLDAESGSYEISTDSSFKMRNNKYLIGLGRPNDDGIIVPVATTLASNNAVTAITPIMKFYIAPSSFEAGEIVDYETYSKNAGFVDFSSGSGSHKRTAVVHHNDDGSFKTVYFGDLISVIAPDFGGNDRISQPGHALIQPRPSKSSGAVDTHPAAAVISVATAADSSLVTQVTKMDWPAATAATIVLSGVVLAIGYMVYRGYALRSRRTTTSPDGATTVAELVLGKRDQGPRSDGAADTTKQDDGDKNIGLAPLSAVVSHQSESSEAGSAAAGMAHGHNNTSGGGLFHWRQKVVHADEHAGRGMLQALFKPRSASVH